MKQVGPFLILLLAAGCSIDRLSTGTPGSLVQSGSATEDFLRPASAADESSVNDAADPASLTQANRSTELIGKEVKNLRVEKLGKVEDLTVELSSGRVIYAVLASGGFLGFGGKLIPLPLSALLQHTDGKTLLLNEDRQALASAPAFGAQGLAEMGPPESLEGLYRFHGVATFANRSSSAPLEFNYGDRPGSGSFRSPSPKTTRFPNQHEDQIGPIWNTRELIGVKVKNQNNENLGHVRDIVVDLRSGRVAYVVLSVNGSGSKLIAVPPMAFAGTPGGLILNADLNKLQSALDFSEDRWPDLSSSSWGARVYRLHGQQPYWDESEIDSSAPTLTRDETINP